MVHGRRSDEKREDGRGGRFVMNAGSKWERWMLESAGNSTGDAGALIEPE